MMSKKKIKNPLILYMPIRLYVYSASEIPMVNIVYLGYYKRQKYGRKIMGFAEFHADFGRVKFYEIIGSRFLIRKFNYVPCA